MRVLQINKLYYPWIGGVERIVQLIAEKLKGRVQIDVLVCNSKGFYRRDIVNGVTVYRSSSVGMFMSLPISPDFIGHFFRLIRRYDVAHFHIPFPLAEMAYLLTNLSVKTVASWHSDIVRQKMFKPFYKFILRNFLRRTCAIIVPTTHHIYSSPVLTEYSEKCVVIPFGIDVSRFALTDDLEIEIKRIKQVFGEKIVLSVGRLVYYKGFEYLIKAMPHVDANLIIIGNGPKKKELFRQIRQLNLEDRVFILDNVPDEKMPAYYHSCDVFVLPSIEKTEAFGLVQLEAMACGKPVINTSLPTGVPLVSKHGETGLTVTPRDSVALAEAIDYLIRNPDVAKEFGEKARHRVQRDFNINIMVERIYRVYEQSLEGNNEIRFKNDVTQ